MTFVEWWDQNSEVLMVRGPFELAQRAWVAGRESAQLSHNTGSPNCAKCLQGELIVKCRLNAEPESPYCHKHRTLQART